jgi:hypothetical protein
MIIDVSEKPAFIFVLEVVLYALLSVLFIFCPDGVPCAMKNEDFFYNVPFSFLPCGKAVK